MSIDGAILYTNFTHHLFNMINFKRFEASSFMPQKKSRQLGSKKTVEKVMPVMDENMSETEDVLTPRKYRE